MSLQRVLEIARKNGMPVIITDNSGQEPMVIMPLEQFEAMSSIEPKLQTTQMMTDDRRQMTDAVDQTLAEMTAERLKNRVEETAIQLESLADQGSENAEISLEERFYLEPEGSL